MRYADKDFVSGSWTLYKITGKNFLSLYFQQVSYKEEYLRITENSLYSLDWADQSNILAFNNLLFDSHLLVLGIYEFVRTLKQAAVDSKQSQIVIDLIKHRLKILERIRMPLAKLESPRKHPDVEEIAYPGVIGDKVGWRISETEFISRFQIAEEVKSMLLELNKELRQD